LEERCSALNGNIYNYTGIPLVPNPSYDDRKAILDWLKSKSDDTYETQAEAENQFAVSIGDYTLNPFLKPILGVEFRLSKRITIGAEANWFVQFGEDLLDGSRWAEQGSITQSVDVPGYYSLRLGFNLGSGEKRVEPLWFVNPMDGSMGDIADSKKKLQELQGILDDDDNDGVPNRLDKEANTPADCPVDVRGKQLDSDEDGIPDCLDKEKFSPPGYPVDPNGVAQTPPMATKAYVDEIKDKMLSKDDPRVKDLLDPKGKNLGDWWLPMIHFDLDKYYIKPQFYEELHHVASVMQKFPNIKVVAKGSTDNRNTNQYNMVLSWNRSNEAITYIVNKYGIPRERFIITFDGEEKELIEKPTNETSHYMNRRVEFHVAKGETDMPRPAGPNAGSNKR
jgi:OmpA-OmpF porin, OOP family